MEDSDDDKPVLAAVMKLNAVKQEVDKDRKVDSSISQKLNATKNGAAAAVKPSSSSSKPSRDSSSAPAPAKPPVESTSRRSLSAVKAEVDSEDDLPISELMKRRSRAAVKLEPKPAATAPKKTAPSPAKKTAAPAEKKSAAPPAKKVKVEAEIVKEKKSIPASDKGKATNVPPGLGADFYQTKKGIIVQRLLCRWWYAIDWPKLEDIGTPPPGYETLEGYVGVFVSTRTDSLGTILDLRNKETAPCLKNFAKMECVELKSLCVSAYEKQMIALAKAEGEQCRLMKDLKSELKEVKAIAIAQAQKESKKYMNGI